MKKGFRSLAVIAGVLAAGALASTAGALIVGTGGAAIEIAPPPSVIFDALESDTQMFAFEEQQCVALTSDLAVDITVPGTYDDSTDLTPGVIPAGTRISSHFVHVDKVGQSHPPIQLEGFVVTDADILGVAILQPSLNRSDFLGAPGTAYPTGDFGRRLNLDGQDDFVIEQVDRKTLVVHAEVRLHADQVRIITGCAERLGGEGCTPGYWKQSQHFDSWQVYSPSDKFEAVFGVDAFAGDPTLLQALSNGGGGIYALGRHATAALLNAVNTDVAYAITSAEVIASTQAALLSGNAGTIESTKNRLAQFNEAGCPLN